MSRDYAFLRGISAYEVLGVGERATEEEIRVAYRRMIAQNHPDRAGSALFAQLLNDAKHVLMNERSDYDAWLHAAATPPGSQNWPPQPPNEAPSAGAPRLRYVATDGRPPYFVPPGAIPVQPRPAPPPPYPPGQSGPFARNSAQPAQEPRFADRMRGLAEQAQRDVFAVFGPATSETQRETYIRTADLLAALRIYRDLVAAAFNDDLISAGLAEKPADFLRLFVHNYRQARPTAERDQAIAVISDVDRSPNAGVLVAMVRLTIEKLAGRV